MVSPIFRVRALDWCPPEPARFDAIILTSANAAAQAGSPLLRYDALPCFCVGETSASAARAAGLDRIITGPSDGAALLEMMAADGVRSALHLCGRDHLELRHAEIRIEQQAVYAADAAATLPHDAVQALASGALPLIHSPRAGRVFAQMTEVAGLQRSSIRVAAISEAAAEALGAGWRSVSAAQVPRDQALLELAAKLCKE